MRIARWVSALLIFCPISAQCFAQTRPIPRQTRSTPPRPAAPAYMQKLRHFEENQVATKGVLKNGLTVIVQEFRAFPVAALLTYIRSGSLDESPEVAGISEVIGRMFYGATTNRGPGITAREIKAMGGLVDCEVSFDHSSYGLTVPAAQWKKALEIQADALLNPLVDPEELKKAIELTLGELRLRMEDPTSITRAKLLEITYGPRGVGRGPLGGVETLRGLNQQKVLTYFRTHYSAPQVVLLIVGDVNAADVLNEAVRLYEKASGAPKPETRARTEPTGEFHYSEIRGGTANPVLSFGFPSPPAESPEFPGMEVLRCLLGVGKASLLNSRMAAEKGTIVGGSAEMIVLPDAAYLAVRMEVEPKNIDRSEIALLTELELLKKEEPAADDLERAQSQLEREYWESLETAGGRVRMLAKFEALGDWKKMTQYVSRFRAVKAPDIPRLAQKYLKLDRTALVEYMPEGSEPRNLTSDASFRTLHELLPSAVEQAEADREKEVIPAVTMPEPSAPFRPSEIKYNMQKASILRGPELYIREDHTLPLIHLGFFYQGGRLQETKDNEGITELMLGVMLRGSKERPASLLFRQLELFGGELTPVVDRDYFGIEMTVLSRNIEPAIELLKDFFLNPIFDEDSFPLQKTMQLDWIREDAYPSGEAALRMAESALFKGFPYSLSAPGTEASVNALTTASVRQWYSNTIHNRKPMIVIVGDTQGTNLAGFFVKNFSGSRFVDTKLSEGFPKLPESKASLEKDRGRGASLVLLAFQAPPYGDEDSYATLVLCGLLDGVGGRLKDQLRDAQGIAYDTGFGYDRGIRGGYVFARMATAPANEELSIKSLEAELHKVLDSPILYRDYRSAVNAAVAAFWIAQQDRFVQIRTLVRSLQSGHGLDGVLEFPGRIQDVRQDELLDIARRIFNFDKSVTVRLHGKN